MDSKEIRDEAQAAQREYARAWRRKNPDKVREINRRYWERKALERLEDRKDEDDGKTCV